MKFLWLTILSFSLLMTFLCVPGTAVAADTAKTDVINVAALVTKAVNFFNKGNEKSWVGLCAPGAPVINSNPPFQFSSCSDWWASQASDNERLGITNGFVTLQPAWNILVNGDHAYAVYPGDYAYKVKGKALRSRGILTIAMQRKGSRWMMTGWSWSQH